MSQILQRLSALRKRIEETAVGCGRDPASVKLMAVAKTFPPEIVEAAAHSGQTLFGENRVQEAEEKIPRVRSTGLIWHLIGHLQSNKARRAVELFDAIQSIDSKKIAAKVGRAAESLGKDLSVYIQVNVGDESQKSGIAPQELPALIQVVESFPRLKLEGLMAIPPFDEDPRPYFRRMRQLLDQSNRGRAAPLTQLSMGMSGDWETAVREGSTLIRVGTAIFGPRDGEAP